ncbi:MAG: hypothetical protein K9L62_10445 [Vallitaleaceae bacterium]|nr:hypothetical protein [Vallitaleaceae bacterium]
MVETIGEEYTRRIQKYIQGDTIFSIDVFFKEVGFLMNQFPEYDFVIKTGDYKWMKKYDDIFDDLIYEVKNFTPIRKNNLKYFHVIRHPKITLATSYDHNTKIDKFVNQWASNEHYLRMCPKEYQLIKLEELDLYPLIQKLLKKTNIKNLSTYTDYDLNDYRTNIFERFDQFKEDLKVIDEKLTSMMKYLGYDKEDKYLRSYLKELYKIADSKIKKSIPIYEID